MAASWEGLTVAVGDATGAVTAPVSKDLVCFALKYEVFLEFNSVPLKHFTYGGDGMGLAFLERPLWRLCREGPQVDIQASGRSTHPGETHRGPILKS